MKSKVKETIKLLGVIALIVFIIYYWYTRFPQYAYLSFVIAALIVKTLFPDLKFFE